MVAAQSPRYCRNGRHTLEERRYQRHGKAYCYGCYQERRKGLHAIPQMLGMWQSPPRDEDRHQRFAAWVAGLDEAIRRVRQAEGFDGNTTPWQTLETRR